jgi:hypothetical protein
MRPTHTRKKRRVGKTTTRKRKGTTVFYRARKTVNNLTQRGGRRASKARRARKAQRPKKPRSKKSIAAEKKGRKQHAKTGRKSKAQKRADKAKGKKSKAKSKRKTRKARAKRTKAKKSKKRRDRGRGRGFGSSGFGSGFGSSGFGDGFGSKNGFGLDGFGSGDGSMGNGSSGDGFGGDGPESLDQMQSGVEGPQPGESPADYCERVVKGCVDQARAKRIKKITGGKDATTMLRDPALYTIIKADKLYVVDEAKCAARRNECIAKQGGTPASGGAY